MLVVVAIGAFYHFTSRSASLARLGFSLGLLMALAMVGQSMTYVLAPLGGPMRDEWLRRADLALGFDWTTWGRWLTAHPGINRALEIAYPWHVAEAWMAVMFLAFVGPENVRGFFRALSITLIVSALIMIPLPAVGELPSAPHVADLTRLRDGSFHRFDLMHTEGLISMPSYHAIMGTLTVLACWPTRARWPVLAFNVVMLIATVHSGAHYLIDVVAGVVLAVIAARVVNMPAVGREGVVRAT
jgi:hypothetical protein